MKNILIIFVVLVLMASSCKKKNEVTECNPIYKTTEMYEVFYKNADTGLFVREDAMVLDSYDSCSFNRLFLDIHFNAEIINNECSDGSIKFVNTIRRIIVTLNNDYNANFKTNDTINDILFLKNVNIDLNSYISSEPSCSYGFKLSLLSAPDSIKLCSFKIEYMESDSTIYELSTMPIFILP